MAHGEICWLCRRALGFGEMEVEHIVPVDLEDQPYELQELVRSLGLPHDFEIESFENWRPSHRYCNRKKSGIPYDAPVVGIEITSKKTQSEKARKIASKIKSDNQLDKHIAAILSALEAEKAKPEKLKLLTEALESYSAFHDEQRDDGAKGEPIDLGFGILVSDGQLRAVSQPYGVGLGPSGPNIPNHMRCGSCGNPYFNGARCTMCGDTGDF